jgi:hypothetical protein
MDEEGVRALNNWGSKYAGLLLLVGQDGHPTASYLNYNPARTGDDAGLNMFVEMGIALGETIINDCPRLHRDVDPISAILPREARVLSGDAGTSLQRAMLKEEDKCDE